LNGCGPGQNYDAATTRPQDAFQLLYEDEETGQKVSELFGELFDVDLIVNTRGGTRIPLYAGKRPALGPGETVHATSYIKKIVDLPKLEQQGDGMRSFAAVLLAVKVMPRAIILIDEPEAFLHPPQERRMGRMLSQEQPDDCQIIVATHSENIIQGLLSGNSDRVSIVRVVRTGAINRAKLLDNARVSELWSSPILRYSNVLSGLFHEGVIVTEADADCRFYDAIAQALPRRGQRLPDLFYTHAGGKDRMHVLITALRALDVPVRAIADVDMLTDERLLERTVSSLGGKWESIQKDWISTKKAIEERKNWFRAGDLKKRIDAILQPLGEDTVIEKKALREMMGLARQTSPWQEIKTNGLPGPLKGSAADAAKRLLIGLSAIGLYIVPVGEIEGFLKTIGGEGSRWVEQALGRDLASDPDLHAAREFVDSILKSFEP
jgi:hypothetical protein